MKYRLEIDADNAIFDDNADLEIARILRDLAERIEAVGLEGAEGSVILDDNGNSIGSFQRVKGGAS